MVYSVLKRNGGAEPFISDKIRSSIEGAVRDSRFPKEKTDDITKELHYEVVSSLPREREITTNVIRSIIVDTLSSDKESGYRSVILSAWTDHERRFKSLS